MNFFKHHIETECVIAAAPDRVWRVLTDQEQIPSWNPFVRRMVGRLVVGATIEVLMQPLGSRAQTFRPKVLKATANEELRWRGQVLMPGLLDAEHYFRLQPAAGGGTRFIHGEHFNGLLVPASRAFLERTRGSFVAMNDALSQRVLGLQ